MDTELPASVLAHQTAPLPINALKTQNGIRIHGRFCLPPGKSPATVMLALHGWTYTNQYWDVGYRPNTYSFARHMMHAGYAVYAIDRIGYGRSTHPPSAMTSLDTQAEAVHRVIQKLRVGAIGGTRFSHVAMVTHSFGTPVSWLESSHYNDADALIGTGWGSSAQLEPAARFISAIATRPAMLDQKMKPEAGLDPGYLTTPPGGRDVNYLYDPSNVDPAMLRYDQNVLRDTTPIGEVLTFFHRFNKLSLGRLPMTGKELTVPLSNQTKKIHVPVFLLDGQKDLFFCGPDRTYCSSSKHLEQEQAPYFSARACERAAVMPEAGHDLNLQRNAPQNYRIIRKWADEAIGPNGNSYSRYREQCR